MLLALSSLIVNNKRSQISAPEGLKNFCGKYPSLRVVSIVCFCTTTQILMLREITGWIDKGLNEKAYIIPGLGDFGERR
jgi:uracil phosphoribosyltransferase